MSMVEVSVADIIVETKNPSTINFVILSTLRLVIIRIITPGMTNKDGIANMDLNSGGVFVRDKMK
jgi:hypothetical protein